MTANTYQVSGTHYVNKPIQPWEVIERNNMGFFDGNALKYVMRFKDKNGIDDLRKAKHYIEKLIELELVVKEEKQQELKATYAQKSVFAQNKEFSVNKDTLERTTK